MLKNDLSPLLPSWVPVRMDESLFALGSSWELDKHTAAEGEWEGQSGLAFSSGFPFSTCLSPAASVGRAYFLTAATFLDSLNTPTS